MRKKLQQLLCMVLVIVSISCLVGVYNVQKQRKQERQKHKEEMAEFLAPDEWQKEHDMDWDGYFETGGYFGDYGDQSAKYATDKVKSLDIKAEYATIHIMESEDVSDVEVFTQIGNSEDAIRCELKDGVLNIIQANLTEETENDGSYIEVTFPTGKQLEKLTISQKGGATSVSYMGKVDDMRIHMDEGSFMAEACLGKTFLADANTANFYIKQMDYKTASLQLEDGVFRTDQMDVSHQLCVKNQNGTVNVKLRRGYDEYNLMADPKEGSVEFAGETIESKVTGTKESPYVELLNETGTITITTGES